MSTTYHLRRASKSCPTCGHDPHAEEVDIGHSAGGWVFLWRGWRTAEASPAGRPLDTPAAWEVFLVEETGRGGAIVDEYEHTHTLSWFREFVAGKRLPHPLSGREPLRYSSLAGSRIVHVAGDDFDFQEPA